MKKSSIDNMKPKISVCVVTYNQVNYIRECLESLINQTIDLKYEIIIGDDNSSDGTSSIVKEFADKHSNIVRAFIRDKNIGPVLNCIDLYSKAEGEFICHMDGDDVSKPEKLELQYNYLKNNEECDICAHNVEIINQHSVNTGHLFNNTKKSGIYNLEDLLLDLPFFAHSSKMFRKKLCSSFWNTLHQDCLDIEIHIEQTNIGKIYYTDNVLGYYRKNVGVTKLSRNGINPLIYKGIIRAYERGLSLIPKNNNKIKIAYSKRLLELAYQSLILKNKHDFIFFTKKSFQVKYFTILQLVFISLTAFPALAFFLSSARNNINKKLS